MGLDSPARAELGARSTGASRALPAAEVRCSVQRTLEVLGERWTLLILREAFRGATRFSEFREALGIAPDVLTQRLGVLVDAGVLEKRSYREPGSRGRDAYHLTDSGQAVKLILGALQQWGDQYRPHPDGPRVAQRRNGTGRGLRVVFVEDGEPGVPLDEVNLLGER
ncbi:helix-turn-helix domain-containing protein [Pseudonocardia eucalypti]|uniref:Helix-turn-helix domain-containing protein n=1 Tax=Pseudonocardia eucalypti TaxID=648755 RepID=A0ABP9QDM4_9PSEU|nr:DNA-binding HxlR family transcriptional regulator [Pseudonocardia eucalypti]